MKHLQIVIAVMVFPLLFIGCKKEKHDDKCEHEMILQPDANFGKDALIFTERPDWNGGTYRGLSITAWTWYSLGYDDGIMRGLLAFNLASLPKNAIIKKAELSLYHNPSVGENTGNHSTRNGSNAVKIEEIIEPWLEDKVTWNNQPKTNPLNFVQLPASTSSDQDYPNIDITQMVEKWHDSPNLNHGVMLKLNNESYYRCLLFASSDEANKQLHPKLVITYVK
jgi:hypothetical protein